MEFWSTNYVQKLDYNNENFIKSKDINDLLDKFLSHNNEESKTLGEKGDYTIKDFWYHCLPSGCLYYNCFNKPERGHATKRRSKRRGRRTKKERTKKKKQRTRLPLKKHTKGKKNKKKEHKKRQTRRK